MLPAVSERPRKHGGPRAAGVAAIALVPLELLCYGNLRGDHTLPRAGAAEDRWEGLPVIQRDSTTTSAEVNQASAYFSIVFQGNEARNGLWPIARPGGARSAHTSRMGRLGNDRI